MNGDLNVNSVDMPLLAQHFVPFNSLAHLDVNKDGRVNSVDMLVIAKNFNSSPCTQRDSITDIGEPWVVYCAAR